MWVWLSSNDNVWLISEDINKHQKSEKTLITSVVGCSGKKRMEATTSTLMVMLTNDGGGNISDESNNN